MTANLKQNLLIYILEIHWCISLRIFQLLDGNLEAFLVAVQHMAVYSIDTTALLLCPPLHRVSLDPTAQRMVGVLRYYLSQFSPKYKKGSVADDSVPEALQKPLAQWVSKFQHGSVGLQTCSQFLKLVAGGSRGSSRGCWSRQETVQYFVANLEIIKGVIL